MNGQVVEGINAAPVIVVGYNRMSVLEETIIRLLNCDGVEKRKIYIYLDGARSDRDIPSVRETYDKVIELTRTRQNIEIVRRSKNLGCRHNIFSAVSEVLNRHGRMILIEDDVFVSRTFLSYMDRALSFYQADKRIWNVNGYCPRYVKVPARYPHDVFLNLRNWTPGWGTWKDRWEAVDFDLKTLDAYLSGPDNLEKIQRAGWDLLPMLRRQAEAPDELNAWDVQCTFHMICNGLYSITPRYSLTKNVGFGMPSEHCVMKNPTMPTQRYYNFQPRLVKDLTEDPSIVRQFKYVNCNPRLPVRIVRKIQRIVWGWGPRNQTPIDI